MAVPCQSQKKVCNGYGPEECRTVYESSCSTRYVEKKPGKFVADTKCKKLPIKDCNSTELPPNSTNLLRFSKDLHES